MAEAFEFPKFHNYPPYFTLQPVADSRAKQISWWKDLILKYCKQCKVHVLSADEDDDSPLFWNKSIQRGADLRPAPPRHNALLLRPPHAVAAPWEGGAESRCRHVPRR